jgi:hypothetical protein
MAEGWKVYRILVEKPEGKRPHGRQRRRWDEWIRMDLTIRENGSSWLRIGVGVRPL